jgi:hypothetical protein
VKLFAPAPKLHVIEHLLHAICLSARTIGTAREAVLPPLARRGADQLEARPDHLREEHVRPRPVQARQVRSNPRRPEDKLSVINGKTTAQARGELSRDLGTVTYRPEMFASRRAAM